jgi:NitT/TauT family transport system permease protein
VVNAHPSIRTLAAYLTVVAVLILVWKAAALFLGNALLPHPEEAVAAFGHALGTAAFWEHFQASSFRVVTAMGVAFGLGFPMGVLMGGSRRADGLLAPFVFLTYPIPKIVLLPVFLLLLGLGDVAKIAMIGLILWYQILVTTRDGVKLVNPKYLDSVRLLGGSRMHIVLNVLLPAGLPHGFTALRLGTGTSVAVLFFVESFATSSGLGYLIMDAWGRMNYPDMFTGIFGMSLLGAALYELANILEQRVCRWKFTQRGSRAD